MGMFGFIQRTFNNFVRYSKSTHSASSAAPPLSPSIPFPVYLINLQRAEFRRRFALDQLAAEGIEPRMIWAVDGQCLDLPAEIQAGVYDPTQAEQAFSRQLSLPEIGCSMSHLNAYKQIVEQGDQAALILEDDALFLPDFAQRLMAAYAELPPDWGILHLNCPCQRFDRVGKYIVKYDGIGSLPVAASAYMVSRRGAERLIENALPLRYPADSLVGRGLRWGVETYGVEQPITSVNNVFPTQIQTPQGLFGRVKYAVKTVLLKLMALKQRA